VRPPSLALTDLKPKDCKLYQDTKQRVYFRFHVFFAQVPPHPTPSLSLSLSLPL
jgi:hypothetical protein